MSKFSFNLSKAKKVVSDVTGTPSSILPEQSNSNVSIKTEGTATQPPKKNLLQQMQAALNQRGRFKRPELSIPKLPVIVPRAMIAPRPLPITVEPDWVSQEINQGSNVGAEQYIPFESFSHVPVEPVVDTDLSHNSQSDYQTEIPPGSHYPEWVWNAMIPARPRLASDRLICVPTTIEIYVRDARADGKSLNLANHCLCNLPVPDAQSSLTDPPWGIAKRVLLIPVQYRIASRTPDLTAVQYWLNDRFNHLDVLGRCSIETPEHLLMRTNRSGPEPRVNNMGKNLDVDLELPEFWVIVHKKDAQAIQKRVTALGEQHSYGRALTLDGSPIRTDDKFQPLGQRKTGTAPSQRYLGAWRGAQAANAIDSARRQVGPTPPGDWQKEELDYLRRQHSSQANNQDTQTDVRVQEHAPRTRETMLRY